MTAMAFDCAALERDGYSVVPGFLPREKTARIRRHIDSLLPPVGAGSEDPARWVSVLRHPIPGPIMAEILHNPALIALATELLGAQSLRLLEQVLIRSDPRPAPHGPLGWHVDWTFFPRHYEAVPKQTYYHMVHCLNSVPAGGAAFMIVPGSHHLTYAASAKMHSAEELAALKRDPVGVAGVDTGLGIEVCPQEGDLLVFNPMALHSASGNATQEPRYVYFASFFDAAAKDLWDALRAAKYRDGFSAALREHLPEDMLELLEW